ncbi:hypothetical protein GEMRC1_008135 [Eukaryota sp. GEM-RC1]
MTVRLSLLITAVLILLQVIETHSSEWHVMFPDLPPFPNSDIDTFYGRLSSIVNKTSPAPIEDDHQNDDPPSPSDPLPEDPVIPDTGDPTPVEPVDKDQDEDSSDSVDNEDPTPVEPVDEDQDQDSSDSVDTGDPTPVEPVDEDQDQDSSDSVDTGDPTPVEPVDEDQDQDSSDPVDDSDSNTGPFDPHTDLAPPPWSSIDVEVHHQWLYIQLPCSESLLCHCILSRQGKGFRGAHS